MHEHPLTINWSIRWHHQQMKHRNVRSNCNGRCCALVAAKALLHCWTSFRVDHCASRKAFCTIDRSPRCHGWLSVCPRLHVQLKNCRIQWCCEDIHQLTCKDLMICPWWRFNPKGGSTHRRHRKLIIYIYICTVRYTQPTGSRTQLRTKQCPRW